jgi:hypothetical protein
MSDSYPLPAEAEGIVAPLLERFHSGKVSAIMALYDPEAVFIANDGRTITDDHTEITARLERNLRLGLPPKAKAPHVSLPAISPGSCWTGQLDGTGHDGKTCTLGAQRAISCARRRWMMAVPDRQ